MLIVVSLSRSENWVNSVRVMSVIDMLVQPITLITIGVKVVKEIVLM